MTRRMFRIALIVSLSVNIFVFSSLAMYCTWLATGWALSAFWRGVTALLVWISTFGAGSVAFWKLIEKMSVTRVISTSESGVSI